MSFEHAQKISVIVPACNAEFYIARCLDSLLQNTIKPFEILVVDDHSADGTAVAVEEYKNRIVKLVKMSSRSGAGAARNYGIEAASGTLLFFIDSDCVAAPDWIERGVEAFRNADVIGLFGAIYYERTPCQIREKIPVNPFYHSPLVNPVNDKFPDFAAGNVAYRAEVARRLG
ncbi:MAG: glycosyltransferase family 2 protein, partial [Bdellovibrionales bacterium]|nr:glycosyltransferase family 2 protein [Bdellovibrionales bacterium]